MLTPHDEKILCALTQPSSLHCWWCTEPFATTAVRLPVRYTWGRRPSSTTPAAAAAAARGERGGGADRFSRPMPIGDGSPPLHTVYARLHHFHFHSGVFCSWPCARAYSRHRISGHTDAGRAYMLELLHDLLLQSGRHPPSTWPGSRHGCAPCPYQHLTKYGGSLSVSEFRDAAHASGLGKESLRRKMTTAAVVTGADSPSSSAAANFSTPRRRISDLQQPLANNSSTPRQAHSGRLDKFDADLPFANVADCERVVILDSVPAASAAGASAVVGGSKNKRKLQQQQQQQQQQTGAPHAAAAPPTTASTATAPLYYSLPPPTCFSTSMVGAGGGGAGSGGGGGGGKMPGRTKVVATSKPNAAAAAQQQCGQLGNNNNKRRRRRRTSATATLIHMTKQHATGGGGEVPQHHQQTAVGQPETSAAATEGIDIGDSTAAYLQEFGLSCS